MHRPSLRGFRERWRQLLGAAVVAANLALDIIGLPSVADDLATWGNWAPMMARHLLSYWSLYAVAVILLWPSGRDIWHWYRKSVPLAMRGRSSISLINPPPKGTRMHPEGGHVWIDDHPFDLMDGVRGKTAVEIESVSRRFKYKWSALEATILDVKQQEKDKDIYVTLETDEEHRLSLQFGWWFDDQLLHLVRGKRLRFVGMIDSFNDKEMKLSNCEPIV